MAVGVVGEGGGRDREREKKMDFFRANNKERGFKKLQTSFLHILIRSGNLDMCYPVKCASRMHYKTQTIRTPGFYANPINNA